MSSTQELTGQAFYKPEELAEVMKAPVSTVYQFIREGRIHAIPWGTGKRIPREEFARILREGVPPKSEEEASEVKR
jgi:excisionase family DNA binding protein